MPDSKLDLSALRIALSSLEYDLEVVRDSGCFGQQFPKVQNTLIAGVIQNFEFVHEVGYKMLRRQIALETASPTDVDEGNFRDVLRLAGEKELMPMWRRGSNTGKCAPSRPIPTTTKAQKAYQAILLSVDDALALPARLEARNV